MSVDNLHTFERGVSTVIGVTVLIGIVVLLAALVGGAVFGIADTTRDTAFAGVTISQAADTDVEVRVNSMEKAEALLIETAGGQQVVTSPGVYEYDSFGKEVRVIGSNGETTQLLQTFEPDVDQTEEATVLTVESDQTVQSAEGNQTFETLEEAKQAADTGDVIQFESGVHVRPNTVNETVTTPVTIVAEPDTVFSCDQTEVNLRLQNATMSQRSAFIQTNQCALQPVTVPAPQGSGGSVDVLAGGTDTSDSAQQSQEEKTTLFDSTTNSDTEGTTRPAATKDTSVTLRISSTNSYESLTVNTQAGSQTFTQPGVYDVETYGYNATVSATTNTGETIQVDSIVTEEQQPDTTSPVTVNGSATNKSAQSPVNTYIVTSDSSSPVSDEKNTKGVKTVQTLKKANELASKGNLIKLQAGVHTHPDTISMTLSKEVKLSLSEDAELSCKEEKVNLNLGVAQLAPQSAYPDISCSETDSVSEQDVIKQINESSESDTLPGSVPETVSLTGSTSVSTEYTKSITYGEEYTYAAGYDGQYDNAYTEIIKVNSSGDRVATYKLPKQYQSLIPEDIEYYNGELYISGYARKSDDTKILRVVKIDTDGNVIWKNNGSKVGRGYSIEVTDNSVYVGGYNRTQNGGAIYKFDTSTGKLEFDEANNSYDRYMSIEISGNSIFAISDEGYVIKHDETGSIQWTKRPMELGHDIVVEDNSVYATGSEREEYEYDGFKYSQLVFSEIDTKSGEIKSSLRTQSCKTTRGYAIEVDSSGSVYIGGTERNCERNKDSTLYKVNVSSENAYIEWTKTQDDGFDDRIEDIVITDKGEIQALEAEDYGSEVLRYYKK